MRIVRLVFHFGFWRGGAALLYESYKCKILICTFTLSIIFFTARPTSGSQDINQRISELKQPIGEL
jgi:hypothetical protein